MPGPELREAGPGAARRRTRQGRYPGRGGTGRGRESAGGGEGRGLEWHELAWPGLTVCSRLDGLTWFRRFGRAETVWVVFTWPRIEARTRVTECNFIS